MLKYPIHVFWEEFRDGYVVDSHEWFYDAWPLLVFIMQSILKDEHLGFRFQDADGQILEFQMDGLFDPTGEIKPLPKYE